MICSEISKSTPLYLSGELDSAATQAFAEHLQSCADCRLCVERDAEIDKLIRQSMASEAPDTAGIDRRVLTSIRYVPRTQRRRLIVAGIAAALAVTAVLYWVTARPNPVFAAAAHDHRVELVQKQPRKWATDPAAIVQLAGRAGLNGETAIAFAPAGYRLQRARLCLLNGRLFLHVVYAGADGNFSFYLRRADPAASTRVQSGSLEGAQVAGFQHQALTAILVTNGPRDVATRLAESAAAIL